MRITRVKRHSEKKLLDNLRKVTLLGSSDKKPPISIYRDANVELVDIPVSSIIPSQFYQLEESFLRVKAIQKALYVHNLDLFHLDGYVSYTVNESDEKYDLLPVIVEYQMEKDGKVNPIIVDGIHRMILARRQERQTIQVIKIANVDMKYPYPAYPNPRGWKDVKMMLSAPELKDKRYWRFPVDIAYNYYRNFNSVFKNVGKPKAHNYDTIWWGVQNS